MQETALNLHLFATIFMTGVIWIIQLVHYPSFRYIDKRKLGDFHRHHTGGITPVVAPVMILELGSIIFLAIKSAAWSAPLLILTILIWLSTFGYQVPLHNKLGNKWSDETVEKLIRSNWVRTILWTGKSVITVFGLIS